MLRPLPLFHPMLRLILALFLCLLPSALRAQSLEAVLSSIQERHDAVAQKSVASWELHAYSGNPPTINPIIWAGASSYPAEGSLDTLGMAQRVALLNQAVVEFEKLKGSYINIRLSYLDGDQSSARIQRGMGILEPYSDWSMPPLAKVTPGNYHQILVDLARNTVNLRVLMWPWMGSGCIDASSNDVTQSGNVLKVGEETWTYSPGTGSYETNLNGSYSEGVMIQGRTWVDENSVEHYTKRYELDVINKIRSVVKGAHGLLDGDAYVVSRENYNPATGVKVNGVKTAEDGAWRVETVLRRDEDGLTPDWSRVEVYSIKGEWKDGYFEPDGLTVAGSVGKSRFYLNEYDNDPGFNSSNYQLHEPLVYSRETCVLAVPVFARGLNADNFAATLAILRNLPVNEERGLVGVSTGSLKFALGLGVGDMGRAGVVGVRQDFEKISRYSAMLSARDGNLRRIPYPFPPYEDSLRVVESPSFLTQLCFIGVRDGYEVLYECRRGSGVRKPLEPWETSNFVDIEKGWAGFQHYLEAWDRPRLRQVIGRDMVLDVDYESDENGKILNDYRYAMKLYWLPLDHSSLEYDADGYLDVSELTLYQKYQVTNPTAGSGFPTNSHKLSIVEEGKGTTEHTATVTDAGDITALSMAVKEGSATLYEENWSKAVPGNVEVTVSYTRDGVAAGGIKTTYPSGTEPLSIAAKPIQILENGEVSTVFTYPTTADGASWGTRWPKQVDVTNPYEPDQTMKWDMNGIPTQYTRGDWVTNWTMESGGSLKTSFLLGTSPYATTWLNWSQGATVLKTTTSPDGLISSENHNANGETTVTLYGPTEITGGGLPWQVKMIKNRDNTGLVNSYVSSGGLTTTTQNGLISGSTVTQGTRTVTSRDARGYPTSVATYDIVSSTKLSGTTYSNPTEWGAPTRAKDDSTQLESAWSYQGAKDRLASTTTPLGVTTVFSGFDALGRTKNVTTNGITATHTFTGLQTSTAYTGIGISGSSATTRDNLGRLVSSNTTWNGVSDNLGLAYGAENLIATRTNSLIGAHTTTLRNSDGSLATATGATLPFGGTTGTGITVENGLLKSQTEINDHPGTYQTTWTDAWGRVRKVVAPSKSGSGATETNFTYSLPSSAIKRGITTEPSGRTLITESEANGTITRTGIDLDGNSWLGSTDRYTESITTVTDGKVVTTLSATEDAGLREILKTKWTPSSGVTETKVNGGEETITTTPDYAAKTVTTGSNKGWSKTDHINNLGLATNSTLSGTGIPHTELKPVWRADGSLASVDFDTITGPNNQKETHTASFNTNGTLSSLIAPGRGNILNGHTILNGVETLAVDGVTVENRLDGTKKVTSGGNVVGKTEELTAVGGLKLTVTPEVGAATQTHLSGAFTPASKTYADSSGESYGYTDDLLTSVSLARGGQLAFGYSTDSAKDLSSATWPAVASGQLTIPGIAHRFEYNRAGQIKTLGDPSGSRSLSYQKGRLSETTYTAGFLKGYQITTGRDTSGRQTGTLIKRYEIPIHVTQKAPNGVSDQITNLASGDITATPQRDGAGRITGYVWSNGTHSVTQTWTRGAGGRIEFAGSDIPGAPTFDYLLNPDDPAESFDTRNRRLKCTTSGGTWTYTYGVNGQLTNATHPTLGTFSYAVDAIGRRSDKGTANTTDILNRTTAWTNSQNKTVKVVAHPDARVWFNGVEIPNFTGSHSATITSPGPQGGWVPWETLAILEGAGEGAGNPASNPLASPDAKAEKKGAVWVPPINETLAYDAAGNRQSSAQWDYGWDAKNQLARARTKNHNTAAQGYDITFTYDAEGRRVKKHVIESQNGIRVAEKIIIFVWDGWDLLYECHQLPSGLTTLERKYLWGPDIADGAAGGAGGLLLIQETKGNTTQKIIPLYDGTGHVVALTNLNKDLLANYAYGPFGEKISATGPLAQSNPFRYATKYFDEETGLYYFGHRYYDPTTGQWLSRELLGESESINLYSYCHNDPLNNVDVLGLEQHSVEPVLNNGIPAMVYADWESSGLGYLWNALAAGNKKTWKQSPSADELYINFYQENGKWHIRSPEDRHNAAWEMIPSAVTAKMEEIKPVMDFYERGGAVMAGAPLVAAAGSVEVGAGIYVYGSQALGSIWVQAPLAVVGTQAAFEFATDEGVRQDMVGAIASDPNGIRATGELLGAGVRGLARMGPKLANSWETVSNGLFPSYAGRPGWALGSTPNPYYRAAKTAGQLGKEGEAAVRAVYNIGEKPAQSILMNGRARIPDGINELANTLSEVKNVGRLSFTRQLRDYAEYAQSQGLRFDLYTRPGAKLSGPLEDAIDNGFINHLPIPGL